MTKKTFYREPTTGKIAGICAGIGRYFSVEVWWIRILAVSIFLLGGNLLVLLAYVGIWLMVEKRPASMQEQGDTEDHALKNKPWQAGKVPSELLSDLDCEYQQIEEKIRKMESYVTSDAYKVNKQFNQL
ncbi:envelope stress response membrane protein PspC [Vibrio sp. S11_S32]|uniref:envelope stress response membrane protein PspC n=1 Tax=Vibrio sp. S11_S32 TaxID=2720225 RepID=UPI0016816D51|nr:envelope stress response membrane protein PspC [Vibrio sp. S11_S32]MBD1577081.1 envelope stress response membrane protein PspC [Vibrio sp. S11_S32]